jgi:hypothetical protein
MARIVETPGFEDDEVDVVEVARELTNTTGRVHYICWYYHGNSEDAMIILTVDEMPEYGVLETDIISPMFVEENQ